MCSTWLLLRMSRQNCIKLEGCYVSECSMPQLLAQSSKKKITSSGLNRQRSPITAAILPKCCSSLVVCKNLSIKLFLPAEGPQYDALWRRVCFCCHVCIQPRNVLTCCHHNPANRASQSGSSGRPAATHLSFSCLNVLSPVCRAVQLLRSLNCCRQAQAMDMDLVLQHSAYSLASSLHFCIATCFMRNIKASSTLVDTNSPGPPLDMPHSCLNPGNTNKNASRSLIRDIFQM